MLDRLRKVYRAQSFFKKIKWEDFSGHNFFFQYHSGSSRSNVFSFLSIFVFVFWVIWPDDAHYPSIGWPSLVWRHFRICSPEQNIPIGWGQMLSFLKWTKFRTFGLWQSEFCISNFQFEFAPWHPKVWISHCSDRQICVQCEHWPLLLW